MFCHRSIRLNFYTTFQKAQYMKQVKPVWPRSKETWRHAVPDATIDLPMTPRGIDIGRARKELGLQAIAVGFFPLFSSHHFSLVASLGYYRRSTFPNGFPSHRWGLALLIGRLHLIEGTQPAT